MSLKVPIWISITVSPRQGQMTREKSDLYAFSAPVLLLGLLLISTEDALQLDCNFLVIILVKTLRESASRILCYRINNGFVHYDLVSYYCFVLLYLLQFWTALLSYFIQFKVSTWNSISPFNEKEEWKVKKKKIMVKLKVVFIN